MAHERNASVEDANLERATTPSLKPKDGLPSPPNGLVKPDSGVEPPEGGTKAWLSLIGAFCAMFVSFGWVNCIALFQAEYERNQLKQYSKSTVSWITSMECEYSFR